jgi:hypothetical protein
MNIKILRVLRIVELPLLEVIGSFARVSECPDQGSEEHLGGRETGTQDPV